LTIGQRYGIVVVMKLTIRQIRDAHKASPEKSGADDALQARYYARPVSYVGAWIALRLGLTANMVTSLTLLTNIGGCILVCYGHLIMGAFVLNVGHLLDYVDGDVARATNTVTNFGRYFDRTCDEVAETIMPIAIGAGLFFWDCNFLGISPLIYLMLGFTYAILHLLSTISILHVRITHDVAPHEYYAPKKHNLWWLLYWIGINMKSATVPILLISAVFIPNGLPIFLLGYTALTTCELVMGVYLAVTGK